MKEKLSVLVVDDHALIAEGVVVALEGVGVTAHLTTGPTADDVLAVARLLRPDVVLLDLQLEGPIQRGTTLIDPLSELGARVVVLTGVTEPSELGECLEAGAYGVARKSEAFDSLVEKVLAAAAGDPVTSDQERYALMDSLRGRRAAAKERLAPFETLTPREAAVLTELMAGRQADGIAEAHYVSVLTVRSQIRAILRKLEVTSQIAAVAKAREAGWEPATVGAH